jgi:hypothetical protein
MDGEGLGAGVRLGCICVHLSELEARAGISERGNAAVLHDLGLHLELAPSAVEEGECEVTVVDRPTDIGQIVGDPLELAGVVRDREITAGAVVERLTQKEVARGAVVEEEPTKSSPGRTRTTVSALNQSVQIVAEGGQEPQRYVDVDGQPGCVRCGRRGSLRDVIKSTVHGQERGDDLPPFGIVGTSGGNGEFDIVGDVDTEEWVGDGRLNWVGYVGEARCRAGSGCHGEGIGKTAEIEGIRGLGSRRSARHRGPGLNRGGEEGRVYGIDWRNNGGRIWGR